MPLLCLSQICSLFLFFCLPALCSPRSLFNLSIYFFCLTYIVIFLISFPNLINKHSFLPVLVFLHLHCLPYLIYLCLHHTYFSAICSTNLLFGPSFPTSLSVSSVISPTAPSFFWWSFPYIPFPWTVSIHYPTSLSNVTCVLVLFTPSISSIQLYACPVIHYT